ncbi:MAG TPA: glutamate--tRNA ligase [Devosiaceae bacterium]|nr:glutamate--tRNA ligase [Devosiaceae bacterium]
MTVVRFAPSPTGRIHVGNARTALLNWLFALKTGGAFILRFDDTDAERSRPEFAKAIAADLGWLGIAPHRVEHQSKRAARHAAARDRLIEQGRLYPCYETADELDRRRKRARALGHPPVYDRAALKLTAADRARLEAEGRKPHWRFRLDGRAVTFEDMIRGPQTVQTAAQSDPVLVREDGSYLYTLPSVVDDIDMGVTHVIRGEDHVTNTGAQIELIEALGGRPPIFAHHNLLVDESGRGLSKRLGSLSIEALREAGYEPLAVALVAVLTGTGEPVAPHASLEALAETFEFSKISRAPARYDPAELDALNARLVHAMEYAEVADRLAALGFGDAEALWNAARQNVAKLPDIAEWQTVVAGPVAPVVDAGDRDFIAAARSALPDEPWDETTWRRWTDALKASTGRKGRALFHPLRLALTGRPDGPELKGLLPVLGRKACLDRLS